MNTAIERSPSTSVPVTPTPVASRALGVAATEKSAYHPAVNSPLPANRWHAVLALALLMVVLAGALALLTPPGTFFTRTATDYYGWQTDAYLSGQLHLKIAPHPAMLALDNPWSTANAPYYIRDLALYDGRYFVYSGIAPILTVMAPVRLATGWFATETFACVVLALVAAVATLAFLAEFRRQCAIQVPRPLGALTVLMTLIGNGALCWLAEIGNTQLAAVSGWAFQSLMLWAGLRALRATHPARWLALASLAFGLSVASRPSLLFAGAALLPFAWAVWRKADDEPVSLGAVAVAVLAPAAIIGAGLAWLNAARFGSPLEFGIRFTLSHWGDTRELTFFSFSHLGPNLWAYLVAAPQVVPEWPFVEVGWRAPVGALFLPYLAGIFGLRTWGRVSSVPAAGRVAVAAAVALLIGNAGPLLLYLVHWSRYWLDLVVPATLLASLGWMGICRNAQGTRRRARVGLAISAAAVNVLMIAAVFFETLD